jgi:GH35 family endo-1,4-beta-xylanase
MTDTDINLYTVSLVISTFIQITNFEEKKKIQNKINFILTMNQMKLHVLQVTNMSYKFMKLSSDKIYVY